jgi:hypothetical protein
MLTYLSRSFLCGGMNMCVYGTDFNATGISDVVMEREDATHSGCRILFPKAKPAGD